ncbi:MAG: hypothetical protein HN390_16815 [Anaerolineae bacterium]|jgi:hypothetical protein|nr:hypothetical protein [Anaerolineae bacterium]MBT7191986.1 hypothetical protein [Anaerolineae bacterium]MBT7992166.1 hypothetical protein [Anaerolineae bacterium]
MKRVLLAALALLLATLACGQPAPDENPLSQINEWERYTTGGLNVDLPAAWEEDTSSDEQVIYTISNGSASLWIKTWELIPSIVSKSVGEWAEKNEKDSLLSTSGDPEKVHLELALTENFNTLRLSTLLIYCDAKAYEITGVAAEKNISEYAALFEKVKASAFCATPERSPKLDSGALGMIVLPPTVDGDNFNPTAYQQALALARENGVQVSHYYFHWGDIEKEPGIYDWTVPDYIVEANALEDFELSIVISVIHTTVRGRIPNDLIGLAFDDPIFVQRLSGFFSAFAERYAGQLHYLSVGNEVNNYFVSRRDEIPAYITAFGETRDAIHAVNPDLPVGIIFAYHDAETLDALDVVQQLNRGDYIAYTMYLYNEGFHFRRDPAEIGDYLDRMIALADGTPIVITETGWSTATLLEGSEEGQAEYTRQLFAALSERRDEIGFVSWFALHDPKPESCAEDIYSFFEPGTEPTGEFMEAFKTFICYFGLRQSDGTPKVAWDVWVEEAEAYYK